MEMTPQRWRYTQAYSREVFGRQDAHLAALEDEAAAAGLPPIAVSADVGRLLMMLASTTRGRLALEVGTLGGYSAIWIARGLAASGRLITIEREPRYAEFAEAQFRRAGLAEQVEVRRGEALDLLPAVAAEVGPEALDFVFLDADKIEYPAYWELVRPLIAPGGMVLADNACGSGSWWIDDLDQPSRRAADRFNRLVAADEAFEAVAVPLRQGVLIARRQSS